MDADGNDEAGFLRKLQNLYSLQKAVDEIVRGAAISGAPFLLTEPVIKQLHKICMNGLLDEAGNYRKTEVKINNSPHIPPSWIEVETHMKALCEYVQSRWQEVDLVHLSAFCLWRLNWIHPFRNGNGRVARSASYLVLCAKYGNILPPKNTVIEQISRNKQPYYEKLRLRDSIYLATSSLDAALKPMEEYLTALLKEQIKLNLD